MGDDYDFVFVFHDHRRNHHHRLHHHGGFELPHVL
jgi:hypothetical protein